MLNEKKLSFTYVSSCIYSMTKCDDSGTKIVHSHNKEKYVIKGYRKNVSWKLETLIL